MQRKVEEAAGKTAASLIPVLALTMCAFCIGTAEFVIMGLLARCGERTSVCRSPAAGWLVTGYALGVAIGAPFMALGAPPDCRARAALIALMGGIFIIGNLLCALEPSDYNVLMFARVVTALVSRRVLRYRFST